MSSKISSYLFFTDLMTNIRKFQHCRKKYPQKFAHVKKCTYLCTAEKEKLSGAVVQLVRIHACHAEKEKLSGAVVQLVRIHACHAWGRGFESRPHRNRH